MSSHRLTLEPPAMARSTVTIQATAVAEPATAAEHAPGRHGARRGRRGQPYGPRQPGRLPAGAAFFLLASVTVFFLAGSAAPTPLYAFYQREWGFSPIITTVVFGVYALAVLTALLLVGSLSDHIGRRPVLLTAIAVQAATMLLFARADSVTILLAARIVQGLATGAAVGAVGAGLVDLHRSRGTLANAVAPITATAKTTAPPASVIATAKSAAAAKTPTSATGPLPQVATTTTTTPTTVTGSASPLTTTAQTLVPLARPVASITTTVASITAPVSGAVTPVAATTTKTLAPGQSPRWSRPWSTRLLRSPAR